MNEHKAERVPPSHRFCFEAIHLCHTNSGSTMPRGPGPVYTSHLFPVNTCPRVEETPVQQEVTLGSCEGDKQSREADTWPHVVCGQN